MSKVRRIDYITNEGGAAIGGRLRRISERIDREAGELYKSLGVVFEQRWFGVLNQLRLVGPMEVGELAAALGVSHVAVSQVRSALEREGLVLAEAVPGDARRRRLSLSEAGRQLVAQLSPTWTAMNEAARDLNQEAGDVIDALNRLEVALDRRSLTMRVRDGLE
jgi:MarR family transcriptional regulator, organic hydroperoxide resistance regulator